MNEEIIKIIFFFFIPVSVQVHDPKLCFLLIGLLSNGLHSRGKSVKAPVREAIPNKNICESVRLINFGCLVLLLA